MAEHAVDLVFTLNDDTEVETSFTPPYSVPEQLDFEEEFGCSFAVIEKARSAIVKAASKVMWVVRCKTCEAGNRALTETQAEIMKTRHVAENVAHVVEIEPPEDPDASVDPAEAYRLKHILWFGWHRARPAVAAKFSTFRQQLKDYRFESPVPEPEPEPEPEVASETAPSLEMAEPEPAPVVDDLSLDDPEGRSEDGSLDPISAGVPGT